MEKEIKIGIIGYGNMGQAMAKGLVKRGGFPCENIMACAGHFDKLKKNTEKIGITALPTAKEVAEKSDMVILAVKPYQLKEVVIPIRELLQSKVVVSVAAGYHFQKYEEMLLPGTHYICTIPNTPIAVGEGILVCEETHSLSKEEWTMVQEIFGKIALIELVSTEKLSIAGTISGCAPAFTAMYLEALADAGVKYGLTRPAAYRMAAKMITGTGKMYLEEGKHPGEMKDAVCSPGGTTIRGVAALEKNGFRGSVISAIEAIEGEKKNV